MKNTEQERADFEDGAWYWVEKEGWHGEPPIIAPAMYKADCKAWYSHGFGGISTCFLKVLEPCTRGQQPEAQTNCANLEQLNKNNGLADKNHLPFQTEDGEASAPPEKEGLMSEILTSKPDAAQMQLPDPVAYIDPTRQKAIAGDAWMVDKSWDALYTEQQVQHLLAAQKFQMDELAMLTRKLVQSLRKAAPDNESAEKALDYLKRKGLGGNPLRSTQEQST